jgi:hypothetical protein
MIEFKCDCCEEPTNADDMESVDNMLICEFCVEAVDFNPFTTEDEPVKVKYLWSRDDYSNWDQFNCA